MATSSFIILSPVGEESLVDSSLSSERQFFREITNGKG
jgi:hypothetical protein